MDSDDDETHQGCEPVDEVVGHVEELKLVGRRGEGGAHDQMHLHLKIKTFSPPAQAEHLLSAALCPES